MSHPTPDDLALVALGETIEPPAAGHLIGCRSCTADVKSLEQVVLVGRSLSPDERVVAPHARVWSRITEDLHDGRVIQLPGSVTLLEPAAATRPGLEPAPVGASTTDELASRRRPAPRNRGTIAVAAGTALVVGLTGGYFLKGLASPAPTSDVGAVTQLNALPRWPGTTGTVSVEKTADGQRTLVVDVELPATISVDGTLEVWMSDSQAHDMLAMGVLTGSSGRFPIPAGVDLATHAVVDVSMEPRHDSDPAHSDDSVVRGRLEV